MRNHSATHLLHFALRSVLGTHVEQKGSLVNPEYFRFDFSHFQKLTDEETEAVERMVNRLIREDLSLEELREVPMSEAGKLGAMALFGEKYGDKVRVIRFGDSVELCGGTHIPSTGRIGLFRILSESSIAAGIRRIEGCTGVRAEADARSQAKTLRELSGMLKPGAPVTESVAILMEENHLLRKKVEQYEKENIRQLKDTLKKEVTAFPEANLLCTRIPLHDAAQIKDLAYQLKGEISQLYLVMGAVLDGKPNLTIMISDELVASSGLNAGTIIRESAREMQGGGGGQPFFATAGGKDVNGLDRAMEKARQAFLSTVK